jgi:uncharacterized protein
MEAERWHVERYPTAAEFLAAAGDWLARAEAENNLVFSVARLLLAPGHPFHEPFYLAAVKQGAAVVGCALCAPPDSLDLTDLPSGAVRALVDSVARLHPRLPAVGGPQASALEFARAWVRECGGAWQVRHSWRLFRLERVRTPRKTRGELRLAEQRDWPQLERWAPHYAQELRTVVDVTAVFARWLARGSLFVWDDDGAKCAVGLAGHTPNGARVSAVYTPPEFRSRGYASNAVAGVARRALDGGVRFCVLFADREAPTPARIYRSVGFEPLRDYLSIDLGV